MPKYRKKLGGKRPFPLLQPPKNTYIAALPWAIVRPHEEQAKKNHCGQNLETLADRGGLSVAELYYVLQDRKFPMHQAISEKDAAKWLEGFAVCFEQTYEPADSPERDTP